ncbi:MAG: PepSY-associated TM helix domain-containing protein, partial [Cyclobacteriaceae bacterium]
ESMPNLTFYGTEINAKGESNRFVATVDPVSLAITDRKRPKTTLGHTLYKLHYFDQIPVIGIYLSGLVALFFLFASITGIVIHWKNMINKFYAFTTQGKWKQIWTNAHTVLGTISLPFQIVYALTGALFGLLTLLLAPSVLILFDGDSGEVFKSIRPDSAMLMDKDAGTSVNKPIQYFQQQVNELYPDHEILSILIRNYGKEDAIASVIVDDHLGIIGDGLLIYRMQSGLLVDRIEPYNKSYAQGVYNALLKLHFANFGGPLLKLIYFLLALITGFMIISGILLWQAARNTKQFSEKQKKFHRNVTGVYLAICLGFIPSVAIIFIANKMVPISWSDRAFHVNTIFFGSWQLIAVTAIIFRKNQAKMTIKLFLLTGILSMIVPLSNGLVTGDWFWQTIQGRLVWVGIVDIFWLIFGCVTLVAAFQINPQKELINLPTKSQDSKKVPAAAIRQKEEFVI